jgi:hypothetical protein
LQIVIYATLMPIVQQQPELITRPVSEYMARLEADPAITAARKELFADKPASAVLAPFQADSAAFKAKQPKLPLPGAKNILVSSYGAAAAAKDFMSSRMQTLSQASTWREPHLLDLAQTNRSLERCLGVKCVCFFVPKAYDAAW